LNLGAGLHRRQRSKQTAGREESRQGSEPV